MANQYKCVECGHTFLLAPGGSRSCEVCGNENIKAIGGSKIPWKFIIPGVIVIIVLVILFSGDGCEGPTTLPSPKITSVTYDSINSSIEIKVKSNGHSDITYFLNKNNKPKKKRTFKNVTPGNYRPGIKYSNNDSIIFWNKIIHVEAPPPPSPPQITKVNHTNETNFDLNDGTILISGTSGSLPIQYSIDNGQTFKKDSLFSGVAPGNYVVSIKDKIGSVIEFFDTINILEFIEIKIVIPPAPQKDEIEQAFNELFSNGRGDAALNKKVRGWFLNDRVIVEGKLLNTNDKYSIYQYLMRQYIGNPGSIEVFVKNITYDNLNKITSIEIEETNI